MWFVSHISQYTDKYFHKIHSVKSWDNTTFLLYAIEVVTLDIIPVLCPNLLSTLQLSLCPFTDPVGEDLCPSEIWYLCKRPVSPATVICTDVKRNPRKS